MKRVWTGVLASAVVMAALVMSAQPAAAAPKRRTTVAVPRAMWVWNRADPATLVNYAGGQGVRELFVYVTPELAASGDLTRLQDLKRRADAAGIGLAALGGEPGWAYDHAAALAWQRTALGTGLFARAHVDVEPYLLSQWSTDQRGTALAYLGMLDALQADNIRPLEADVPFWYGQIPTGYGNLADEVLRRVDAVTVMSYRDTATGPNSIMEVGTDMLARGVAAGKPVRLGVETGALADCLYCTFYEEGRQVLATAMTTVDGKAAGYRSYRGIAVHHYTAWVALRR